MNVKGDAARTLGGGAGGGHGNGTVLRSRLHCSTEPVALQAHKRGRWCTVAKITYLDGAPVLAVAWRNQAGTKEAISLPVAAIEYAKGQGVQRFYLRDDRRLRMYWCDLALFDRGRLQADGERYIPLDWLQPTAWRDWPFAEKTVRLEEPKERAIQRALVGLDVEPLEVGR